MKISFLHLSILVIIGITLGKSKTVSQISFVENAFLKDSTNGLNKFSMLISKSYFNSVTGNAVLSPLSLYFALGTIRLGANGNTLQQLRNVLNVTLNDIYNIRSTINLINDLKNKKGINFTLATKVFTSDDYVIKEDFISKVVFTFKATLQSMNFNNSARAVEIINEWVKKETNNVIDNLLTSGDVNSNTVMLLLNVIYYKAKWQVPFDSKETRIEPFVNSSNQKRNVTMMTTTGKFKVGYNNNLLSSYILLPYENTDFNLLVILPNEVNGLKHVQQTLNEVNITELITNSEERNIQLSLPKFKMENKIDMQSALTDIGLGNIFSQDANFDGISASPIHVNSLKQKVSFEVNEEGSEAAIVTEVDLVNRFFDKEKIIVNRPVILMLLVEETPILCARIEDLEN